MATQDVPPPPRKEDQKFDHWLYQFWKRVGVTAAGFVASSPITIGTGAGTYTWGHSTSGVASGTYGSASIIPQLVVNTYGHVTAVNTFGISVTTSGTAITGTDLVVSAPLTGTATNALLRPGTIGHGTSGVASGTYGGTSGSAQFVVDTYGHVTSGTTVQPLIPQNIQNGNYTVVVADTNKHIYREGTATGTATWTIPSGTLSIGAPISFVNQGTGPVFLVGGITLRFFGTGATGTRTLGQYGWASLLTVHSTEACISGVGLT